MSIKERPIIFDAESIRAILEGRKTQTRRVPSDINGWFNSDFPVYGLDEFRMEGSDAVFKYQTEVDDTRAIRFRCRFGKPGDRLWVAETWTCYRQTSYEYDEWEHVFTAEQREEYSGTLSPVYRADKKSYPERWNASIHMPRWASRITLEITEVRVERLQEISYEDVLAEGIEPVKNGPHANQYYREDTGALFVDRWDKINGKRFPWASNPWVWVISFRRMEPNT